MSQLKTMFHRFLFLAGIEANVTSHSEKIISAVGAFLGIAGVYWVSSWYLEHSAALMMVASMGATAVLVFAVPNGALSQPWPVVGGHLISAFIGVSCLKLLGQSPWTPAITVGLAVGTMYYLRCIHPPGGATALTAVMGSNAVQTIGFDFIIFPVLINVVSITAVAVIFNAAFEWRRYPARLTKAKSVKAPTKPTGHKLNLTHEDFAAAMQELNSLVAVTPDELAHLFELAVKHSEQSNEHPADIADGRYYSNGQLGRHWCIRQIIDVGSKAGNSSDGVVYKIVAGDASDEVGRCRANEFREWARFEVMPSDEGHWMRVNAEQAKATRTEVETAKANSHLKALKHTSSHN